MREFRCLVFSKQEALMAVIDRRRRLREPLPVGTVRDILFEVRSTDGVVSTIEIVDDYGQIENLSISAAEMAASLIDYCINHKIPFPSGSTKWIEVLKEGEVTLLLTIDSGKRKRPLPAKRAALP